MAALSGAIAAFSSDTLSDSIKMVADNLYLIPLCIFYVIALFLGVLGTKYYDSYSRFYSINSHKSGDVTSIDIHISFEKNTTFEEILTQKTDARGI